MAGVSASRRRCGRCWAQRRAAWPSGAAEGTTWRPTRLTALSDKAEKICRTCSICLLLFCGSALIPKVGQQERKIQTSSNSMFVSWGFCFHLVSSTQQQNQCISTATPTEKTACLFLFPPLGRRALLFLFCFASRRRGNAAEVWIEECQSMELSVSYLWVYNARGARRSQNEEWNDDGKIKECGEKDSFFRYCAILLWPFIQISPRSKERFQERSK